MRLSSSEILLHLKMEMDSQEELPKGLLIPVVINNENHRPLPVWEDGEGCA